MSNRYIGGLIYNAPGGWSGYFDGTGDYLSTPNASAYAFGTGDFTVECWINTSSAGVGLAEQTGGTTGYWMWHINGSSGNMSWQNARNSNNLFLISGASTALCDGRWHHLAIVRSSSVTKCYWDGVEKASASDTTNYSGTGGNLNIAYESAAGYALNGFMSNFRIVKGTAIYTAAFTPPNGPLQAVTNTSILTCAYPTFRDGSTNAVTITVNGNAVTSQQNPFPLTNLPNPALGGAGNGVFTLSQYQQLKAQGLWPAIDPYYRNVVLNLHGNGTNGGQNNTFLDSSSNNFTITRNGNTTQGAFAPYGINWSVYLDGAGDFLRLDPNAAFNYGTGNFTIECWFNLSAKTAGQAPVAQLPSPSDGAWRLSTQDFSGNDKVQLVVRVAGSWVTVFDISQTWNINAWYHVAIARSGSTLKAFVNGNQVGSTTFSSQIGMTTADTYVGYLENDNVFFKGYVSNVRIVKGAAVYTSSFAPIEGPLSAVSGTSVLTCQNNRFIDNSGNNFVINYNGDVFAVKYGPFNPPIPYDASWAGGSGYFDGSGDYLVFSNSSAFAFGTGSFTIEFWINGPLNNDKFILGGRSAIGSMHITTGGSSSTAGVLRYVATSTITSGSVLITNNAWHHCAIVRNGSSNVTLYVDGVVAGTGTDTNNYTTTSGTWVIGANDFNYPSNVGSNNLNAYLCGLRIVNGTAVYTGAFTPPTAPPTAITNTSLLLNFTNGSIVDNSMMNDLETVGNAQISTTQKKYGTASMYFDGTGDGLRGPANMPQLQLGTGDFTVECWLYQTATNTYPSIVEIGNHLVAGGVLFIGSDGSTITAYSASYGGFMGTAPAPALNRWNHIAWVRYNGTFKIYVNGVGNTGVSVTTNFNNSSTFTIGAEQSLDSSYTYTGYIDDLRITRSARYLSNFTPPTSQVQDM